MEQATTSPVLLPCLACMTTGYMGFIRRCMHSGTDFTAHGHPSACAYQPAPSPHVSGEPYNLPLCLFISAGLTSPWGQGWLHPKTPHVHWQSGPWASYRSASRIYRSTEYETQPNSMAVASSCWELLRVTNRAHGPSASRQNRPEIGPCSSIKSLGRLILSSSRLPETEILPPPERAPIRERKMAPWL
jgi:hypothetical protein